MKHNDRVSVARVLHFPLRMTRIVMCYLKHQHLEVAHYWYMKHFQI